ncbi:MAG: ribonuclease P protein component [Nitrospirae bacterium]|nr:ribonuclease P protein component [Nitrospirota bacterium]
MKGFASTWLRFRLRKGWEYLEVYRQGRRDRGQYVTCYVRKTPGERVPRVGIVVGRKVGCAVVRNRVKRRLREAIRHIFTGLPPGTAVIVSALEGTADVKTAELERDLLLVLKKMGGWKGQT